MSKVGLKNKKGFSIGEVLVSLFILIIGVATTFELVSKSINHSIDSRNTMIAAGLAQEAIELTRNIRDNNLIHDRDYDQGLGNGTNKCIDYKTDTINDDSIDLSAECSGGADPFRLYFDGVGAETGYYAHDVTSVPTRFYRKVNVDDWPGEGKKITVFVKWGDSFYNESQCDISNKCIFVEHFLAENR